MDYDRILEFLNKEIYESLFVLKFKGFKKKILQINIDKKLIDKLS